MLTVVAVAAWSAGCAARVPPKTPLDLARADSLVRQGCYDCLVDARTIYDSASGSERQATRMRALEVELLLVLREKELAIDSTAALARAKAIAAETPPASNAAAAVAFVESIAPDFQGSQPSDRRPTGLGPGADVVAKAQQTIAALPLSPLVRDYLLLTVRCSSFAAQTTAASPRPDAPLYTYRAATCGNSIDADVLERLREGVPRFVEAALFQGRSAMARIAGSDGARARILFEEAYARFPTSPAVTLHLGTVHQAIGDCRRAQDFFTETLALKPAHEAARLGRAICRTYLNDGTGAVADATVLIDAVAGNRAEAYYWRAWTRRLRKELELARADIDISRTLLFNARVLTLAGMIEHDQRDFDKARVDLREARSVDPTECTAPWYLGLVGYTTEQWAEAARGFVWAADCYTGRIATSQRERAAMAAREDLDPVFRARQMAGFDAAIADDATQRSASDLNAALNYARAADIPNATAYMKRAAVDPQRRAAVEELRLLLGVPPW